MTAAASGGPATVLVSARGLRAGYGDVPVCAPVDLTVAAGEVLALVGANGAGKSTVLRTVLGLQPALGGEVRLVGHEPDERSAEQRARVASVLDDDAWFPGLTAREHLLVVAAGHGVADPAVTVDDVLALVGLADHGDALPSAMSSGQRRRLLLAGAFVRPADLLVLDEPEQRLDTTMRATLADVLRARSAEGTGVLLATHDSELVLALGADVLLVGDEACERVPAARASAAMRGAPTA